MVQSGHTDAFRLFDRRDIDYEITYDEYGNAEVPGFGAMLRDSFEAAGYTPWMIGLTAVQSAWAVAEAVSMLTNRRRRALHDLISGTLVVAITPMPPPPPPSRDGDPVPTSNVAGISSTGPPPSPPAVRPQPPASPGW